MTKIIVENTEIRVMRQGTEDFISLTDMVRSQMQEHIIFRWLSLKSTIEYLGEWEMLYNPKFNCIEFGTIRNEAGKNNFILSVKNWIERTGAIGIVSKAGRYGGTYANKDIAYHFGMWISPRFQLLLVKEYQRLKAEEQKQLGWSAKRELAKINYHIHTSAVSHNLIPPELTAAQKSFVYADETDLQSKIYTIRGTEQLHELICRFLHDPADVRSLNVKSFSFYAESVFYSEKVGAKLFHVIVSVIVFGYESAGCSDVDQSLCFAQAFRDSRFIIDKSQSVHAYRFDIAF